MSLTVDIHKTFPGFELDVSIEAGNETLGFLGGSGCGKSLTLRCIAGVETPDEGRIVVNDQTFFEHTKGDRSKIDLSPQQRKTALLFQNYQLFPNLTVADNIAAGIPRTTPKDERKALVHAELSRFGLTGLEKHYPAQISGGQQQRVALARMLAAQPDILMLDEPFSALDSHLKGVLEQSLVSLFDAFKGTILYVSHDIDEALRFCDRIAVVENGRVMEIDTGDELVHHPRSLAGIKLSGCKNATPAEYRSDHRVFLPQWGVEVETETTVPYEIRFMGVRGFYLKRSDGPGRNCFRMRVDRVSDSRFERTAILTFLDRESSPEKSAELSRDEMHYLKQRLYWRVDKLSTPPDTLPAKGDELWIHIPPQKVYLVTR
ncbi:MAG: ATP-binding cassette domain-containing protein [Eggerthellaceae bacterium]